MTKRPPDANESSRNRYLAVSIARRFGEVIDEERPPKHSHEFKPPRRRKETVNARAKRY